MRPVQSRGLIPTAGLILAFTIPGRPEAGILRVPQDFARIDQALAAATPGDEVHVAAGIYSPGGTGDAFPLMVPSCVVLAGAGLDLSILDAQAQGSVVHLIGASARVTGFTLTGGLSSEGGGVRVFSGVSATVDHNLIQGNRAGFLGSGIYVAQSASAWIHHNVVWENLDQDVAAAGDPHGIQFNSAGGLVEHNVVGRGDSNGIFTNTSSVAIRNNIILENGLPGVRGRGICAVSGAQPVIAHNIFFGNQVAAILVAPGVGDLSAGQANDLLPNDGVYGNLDPDPLFVDAEGGDWHVTTQSPAIDAGDPASPLDPDGTQADIGAFYVPHESTGVPGGTTPLPFQASPNPLRDATVFHYQTFREEQVTLSIHDALGRRVRVLLDRREAPGPHLVRWDGLSESGTRVARGVYFAHLRAGSIEARRTILLIP